MSDKSIITKEMYEEYLQYVLREFKKQHPNCKCANPECNKPATHIVLEDEIEMKHIKGKVLAGVLAVCKECYYYDLRTSQGGN